MSIADCLGEWMDLVINLVLTLPRLEGVRRLVEHTVIAVVEQVLWMYV